MSVSLYDLSVASHLQILGGVANLLAKGCLLYTSDAADE